MTLAGVILVRFIIWAFEMKDYGKGNVQGGTSQGGGTEVLDDAHGVGRLRYTE